MIEQRPLTPCTDEVILNQWHVVAASESIAGEGNVVARLLETHIVLGRRSDGTLRANGPDGRELPLLDRFGYVWVSLGSPAAGIFDIPECAEPDRRNLHCGSVGINVSAPRAVENFLDMGHFPFVHTGYLGIEPITEVKPYTVTMSRDAGVLATQCRFYQPRAEVSATTGVEIEYTYRVPHPYAAVLYKTAIGAPGRVDVIALFLQPLDEEHVIGHLFGSFIDTEATDADIRIFALLILSQDKPILENQYPKRLPLDLRSELPVKCDASSIAYRRWLRECGVQYGTLSPAV
jgi:phenylpropionate dioxygenase-like ring-hydroxylating dioxygenase large terminal subunit